LISVRNDNHALHLKNLAKEELAIWMVQTLTRRTEAYAEQLEINVFLFSSAEGTNLSACVRVPGAKHRAPDVTLDGSILHWVARTGVTIRIPNTHYSWHPFNMLPDVGSANRSKLVVPLTEYENGKLYCWGVVSVGSSRPFFFHSRIGRGLTDVILPLTALLQLIIHKPAFKHEVECL